MKNWSHYLQVIMIVFYRSDLYIVKWNEWLTLNLECNFCILQIYPTDQIGPYVHTYNLKVLLPGFHDPKKMQHITYAIEEIMETLKCHKNCQRSQKRLYAPKRWFLRCSKTEASCRSAMEMHFIHLHTPAHAKHLTFDPVTQNRWF